MNRTEIEATLLTLIADCSDGPIPTIQLQEMVSLVNAGEPGVALENLCTQLFEYDVRVHPHVTAQLASIGRAMGIDERYWQNLTGDQS